MAEVKPYNKLLLANHVRPVSAIFVDATHWVLRGLSQRGGGLTLGGGVDTTEQGGIFA